MALMIELFPEHLQAIGTIAVRWSSVDRLLYDILLLDFGMEAEAETLRSCRAGVSRLEFFKARLKEAPISQNLRGDLATAVEELMVKAGERNVIIHGQYGVMVGENGLIAPSYSDIGSQDYDGRTDRRVDEPVTIEHLLGHADEVRAAAETLRLYRYRRPD